MFTLAEFYLALARIPCSPRVAPFEANRFLDEKIFPYFEIVALSETDHRAVIGSCANAGMAGAGFKGNGGQDHRAVSLSDIALLP